MEEIMATKSSIMDSNSFKEEYTSLLDSKTKEMIDRREKYLGGAYRLFYRKPVNLVKGEGDYLWDSEGNKYLDMYNNVAGVGHCNPAVVKAVNEQMKQLNTHTRYLHEKILDYSEELLGMMPDEIDKIMYMGCTGIYRWYRNNNYSGGLSWNKCPDIRMFSSIRSRTAITS